MASAAKIEFDVENLRGEYSTHLADKLTSVKGVSKVEVDTSLQKVIIETSLPSEQIRTLIEATGSRAVLSGYGSTDKNLGTAVAMISEGDKYATVRGITRFVQVSDSVCLVDGTVDGLVCNEKHGLFLHEYGDISEGCESTGPILDFPDGFPVRTHPYGRLGEVMSDNFGRASFRFENERVKVYDIIGRSLLVHGPKAPSAKVWDRLACGIVARSAGLFQNTKKICSCDGVTVWDERDVPLAGGARQTASSRPVPLASL